MLYMDHEVGDDLNTNVNKAIALCTEHEDTVRMDWFGIDYQIGREDSAEEVIRHITQKMEVLKTLYNETVRDTTSIVREFDHTRLYPTIEEGIAVTVFRAMRFIGNNESVGRRGWVNIVLVMDYLGEQYEFNPFDEGVVQKLFEAVKLRLRLKASKFR